MIENQIRMGDEASRDLPVTVLREMWPKPGSEEAFEKAMSALIQRGLEWPGHLGASVIKPAYRGGPYRFVYKFDRRSNLEAWHASPARAEKMETVRHLIVNDRFDTFDGLEAWLNLPVQAPSPPRWKTLLVNWIAIFPTVSLVGWLLAMALRGWGLTLHPLFITFLVTAIVVPAVAFITLPLLTRLIGRWIR